MPAKKILSPRQTAILKKLRLLPFQSARKIAQRTKIPLSVVQSHPDFGRKTIADHLRRIQHLKRDPRSKMWAYHPNYWAMTRVTELASTYTGTEIRAILMREKESNALLKDIKVPNTATIYEWARAYRKIEPTAKSRPREKSSKREQNNLDEKTRQRLQEIGAEMIRSRRDIRIRGVDPHEFRSHLLYLTVEETKYFIPHKNNRTIEEEWKKYLKHAISRYWTNQILRRIGPLTPRGNPRFEVPVTEGSANLGEGYNPAERATAKEGEMEERRELPNLSGLTEREKKVVMRLIQGGKKKSIAHELGLSREGLRLITNRAIKKIRHGSS